MLKNDKSLPNWVTVSLFSLWVGITVLGLWWFQQEKLKPFIASDDDSRYFQAQQIDILLQPYLAKAGDSLKGQQTLLHFWRPDCLCNNISQRHFNNLIKEFSHEELRIIIIAHPNSSSEDISELEHLNKGRLTVIKAENDLLTLPSSPSLAIFNNAQKLSYFGAYGFGAFCTVREDGFLSSVIENNNKGEAATFTNVIGDGCFCQWKN